MRIDHLAYQRATQVGVFGLFLQAAMAITLIVFGLTLGETTALFAGAYVAAGTLVWLSLIIVFHQHKLERLETLKEDELAATRAGGSAFQAADEDLHVAARRLRLMHAWLMPGISVLLVVLYALGCWIMLGVLGRVRDGDLELGMTEEIGWYAAFCLAFAVVSFIASRFVAGMAKQPAWQNLRGGAAVMVGNALVLFTVAVGIGFRIFENDHVIRGVAYAIPVFMLVLGGEIFLNFVLNLYRPRVPGEVPRPAFDSRLLSLLAMPDNIVRTLNEAVNYQFGFDITSSWGYQLLLRSVSWLLAFGLVVMILLNMMTVIEPHEQGVLMAGGRIVGDRVRESGIVWKLPWPLQTVAVHDVRRVRPLALTARLRGEPFVRLWSDELQTEGKLEPFLVGGSRAVAAAEARLGSAAAERLAETPAAQDDGTPAVAARVAAGGDYALVDAEIVLQYRIRQTGNGLLEYLRFSTDAVQRSGQRLTMREQALRSLALREVSRHLVTRSLDETLGHAPTSLSAELRDRIQAAFDAQRAGIEIVSVDIPTLRPAGESARQFEELAVARQGGRELVVNARQQEVVGLVQLVGRNADADAIVAEVQRLDQMAPGDEAARRAQRVRVEQVIAQAGGAVANMIAAADNDRWSQQMAKRRQARQFEEKYKAYLAAPRLYRQREVMSVLAQNLAGLRKYVLSIDPSRVEVDMSLKELSPILTFEGERKEGEPIDE